VTRHAARLTVSVILSLVGARGAAYAQGLQPVPAPAGSGDAKPSDILPGRPDADFDAKASLVGPVFESKGHGISLRPPKDSLPVRRVGSKDIIEFYNESNGWTLKVSKLMLPKPGKLTEWRDPEGQMQPGVLEFTAKRLKEELPDAEFVRQDTVNIRDGEVGMLALRYTSNLKSMLAQQAIVQRTDQMYYLLALTTPGAPKGSKDDAAGASEKVAIETFRQILDSVELLDLKGVREDQDARLYRTRGLLVNLTPERLKKALVPQRWTRVMRKGKDIGYLYAEEKTEVKGAQEGVEIRTRSRLLPNADLQVDAGSILFTSMDLRHEDWSTLTEFVNVKERAAKGKEYRAPQLTENGIADRRAVPGQGDVFALQVLFESTRERLEPVVRDLPPFYLPQAMSHLLPRLVPLGAPKTYMFYVYVPETREVMLRFVDVKDTRKVELGHELVRAVPVEDRIGLEGPVTIHYLSPGGQWLGSESKDTGVTLLPATKEVLENIWKDANLTRPEDPKAEEPKPREANSGRAVGQ
jgi:hypothetical protein